MSDIIGIDVKHDVYKVLNLDINEKRVRSGLLAEGTMSQVRDAVARLLIYRGFDSNEAAKVFYWI